MDAPPLEFTACVLLSGISFPLESDTYPVWIKQPNVFEDETQNHACL